MSQSTQQQKEYPVYQPPKEIPIRGRHEKVMYIVRGLPGCGKSTFCKNLLCHILELPVARDCNGNVKTTAQIHRLCQNYIMSTDDYFTTINNEGNITYTYDKNAVQANHTKNKNRTKMQAELGITPLFIDNTNISLAEMVPYVKIATDAGYHVFTIEPQDFWITLRRNVMHNPNWLHENSNTKGIPHSVFKRMADKYEHQ